MKTPPTVKITQDPEAPVAIEILAESIVSIAQGVKNMLAGPLTEKAIVLLITHACPMTGGRFNKRAVSPPVVRAVLEGIEALEHEYLKPRKVKP